MNLSSSASRQSRSSFRVSVSRTLHARLGLLLLFATAATCFAQVDTKVRPAPDFGSDGVWLDQGAPVPHHIADYRGKVVLVDFWEYTCINCIRDFGVVKRWYTKYHQYGFDVIGVHFGEFNIGFDVNNVKDAAQRLHLPWPVLADLKGSSWKAFDANGWPDRILIDPEGKIVMKVFGEGNNVAMETKIRELLAVAHPEVLKISLDAAEDDFRPECGVPTQETYVGETYGRSSVLDMENRHAGDKGTFMPPHSPPDGGVMLVGHWRVEKDGVTTEARDGGAEIRYHARSLYAVLSLSGTKQVKVYLFQDGNPLPKDGAGADVKFDDKGAYVEVTEARMYYLVRSPGFSAHLISLNPDGPGLTLHSFTFGNNCQLDDQP